MEWALVALLATSAAAANILSHPDYQACAATNCDALYVLAHGLRPMSDTRPDANARGSRAWPAADERHPPRRERAWQLRVLLHGCSRTTDCAPLARCCTAVRAPLSGSCALP